MTDASGQVDLQTLKCPANKSARDMVVAMKLYGDGATKESYTWSRDDDGNYCWINNKTMLPAVDVYLQVGDALWATTDLEAEDIIPVQSNGQVREEDFDVELVIGESVICGNATPVEIDLQDILCPANKSARDMVVAMKLYGDGATKESYTWSRDDDGNYCWINNKTMLPAVDVSLLPGEALWITFDLEAEEVVNVTFPGVELK